MGFVAHQAKLRIALAAAVTAAAVGCASPGSPRAPSLNLPALVHDLHAERAGDVVRLSFTTPTRTSDRDRIPWKGPMTVELCRQTPAGPCAPVMRETIPPSPATSLSGSTTLKTLVDPLPPPLTAGPAVLLIYRVQLFNAKGSTAGPSDAAYTVAGAAPAPVSEFTVAASAQGAVLRWRSTLGDTAIELERIRTSTPAAKSAAAKASPFQSSESDPAQVNLRAGNAGDGGAIDTTAKFGQSYTYTVTLVRALTLAGHALEIRSAPSAVAAIEMRDTFPPAVPQGLIAIPATGAIDLSWEPNTELDLAGYIVYRAVSGSATPPVRLNPEPVQTPAFHDAAVQPGQRYRYSISAIDASGNESSRSAEVDEIVDAP